MRLVTGSKGCWIWGCKFWVKGRYMCPCVPLTPISLLPSISLLWFSLCVDFVLRKALPTWYKEGHSISSLTDSQKGKTSLQPIQWKYLSNGALGSWLARLMSHAQDRGSAVTSSNDTGWEQSKGDRCPGEVWEIYWKQEEKDAGWAKPTDIHCFPGFQDRRLTPF